MCSEGSPVLFFTTAEASCVINWKTAEKEVFSRANFSGGTIKETSSCIMFPFTCAYHFTELQPMPSSGFFKK